MPLSNRPTTAPVTTQTISARGEEPSGEPVRPPQVAPSQPSPHRKQRNLSANKRAPFSVTLTTGASARRASVHPAVQWGSLHGFHGVMRIEHPRAVLTTPHAGRWQRVHQLDCLRPLPGHLPAHGQCPGQPAPGQPMPVPAAASAADS